MNVALRLPEQTSSAEDFERRLFTVADILRMQEVGIIDPDERFELIEGEIIRMQSKNFPHERIKLALVRGFSRALPDDLQLGVETSFFASNVTILEPDLSVFPMMNTEDVRGPDILLVVEVADTTFRKDKVLKAPLYAKYGVQELWVIDVNRLETHVHREPLDGQWRLTEIKRGDEVLSHASAPGFSLKLRDLA